MSGDLHDWRLQALLDGELAAADAAALLAEVHASPALRERLGELTADRALLRQAYAHAMPPVPAGAPVRRAASLGVERRGLVVAGLALFGLGGVAGLAWRGGASRPGAADALAEAPAGEAGTMSAIVLHVGDNDHGQALAALARAEQLLTLARDQGRELSLDVVANRGGLDLLRAAASPDAARVQRLQAAFPALRFVACGQTVDRLRDQGDDVRLLPGTVVASSALDHIVQRLQQGWTYLRV
ncbi:MAG: hypothetical protein H6933_05990 [Burkholderiaceae bacterium]|nr:hypothetical protein [Rhodoferax sp.]MCP5284429.1 hypothetical protein [Burkholderiaceae bacterium]